MLSTPAHVLITEKKRSDVEYQEGSATDSPEVVSTNTPSTVILPRRLRVERSSATRGGFPEEKKKSEQIKKH